MDYDDLDPELQEQVVGACLNMLSTMTEVFGVERGNEILTNLRPAIGEDVSNAVMFALLTGQYNEIVMYDASNVSQYVELIKAVRNHTGYGLKEAKDACDLAKAKTPVKFKIKGKARMPFVNDLRRLGARVS